MNVEKSAWVESVHDEGIFYRLFQEAEAVRWKMSEYRWSEVKRGEVSPAWLSVARETLVGELTTFSATERFFADFADDVDFTQWLTVWLYEETKHPSALLKWLDTLGEKFDSGFMLQGRQTLPFMPLKMGTLATNVVSEMVASTLYMTLRAQQSIDPVLKAICGNIGGDEARHAASFYSFASKRLSRAENPEKERLDALRILHFWITPELNTRVGHPVNLLANRLQAMPAVQAAVPAEAIRSAVETTYRRTCRLFGTLLQIPLRDRQDVSGELDARMRA